MGEGSGAEKRETDDVGIGWLAVGPHFGLEHRIAEARTFEPGARLLAERGIVGIGGEPGAVHEGVGDPEAELQARHHRQRRQQIGGDQRLDDVDLAQTLGVVGRAVGVARCKS